MCQSSIRWQPADIDQALLATHSFNRSPSISSPHIQNQDEYEDEEDDSEEDTFGEWKLDELIRSYIKQWTNDMEMGNKLLKCYLDTRKMSQIKRDTTQFKQREVESAIMSPDTTRMAPQEAKYWSAQKRKILRKMNLTPDKRQLDDDELLSPDSSDDDELSSDSSDDDELFSDSSDDEFVLLLIMSDSVP
ncbi:hypothetical protein Cgig2_012368 [Carnegiea gigantea]|uniref:Uncharacterized protein n=1 Tax=Carnegiea gigantea TaxID=171969 RepID=A0A9Q1QLD4_9CARY|nr:hypothetical protein Cgig2_012368 [Carnegiea gigantea]